MIPDVLGHAGAVLLHVTDDFVAYEFHAISED